jgi:methionyl aminopeptidase
MDIDELVNYINGEGEEEKKKKKKKTKKKNKPKTEEPEKIEIETIENQIKNEEKKEISKIPINENLIHQKKKHKKEYIPKYANTDSENNSVTEKTPFRENPYREIINKENLEEENKEISTSSYQDNSKFRLIGNWEEKKTNQTIPITKSIDEQYFSLSEFSEGIIMEYPPENIWRSNSEEKKELEKYILFTLSSMRKAGECHRQIRKYAQRIIKPGIKLIDMCKKIENMLKFITNANLTECGQAFPTGCSLNNIAAHYTPNSGDETILKENDVMKLDFGTQINGYIIDCAFTVAFNPIYDNLLKASKEATNEGIKLSGIDARLCEIGGAIEEIIKSYEIELNGKNHKIKPIKDLCGHTLGRFRVHGNKSVPLFKNEENTMKMEEGELYAIETFASTGKGRCKELKDWSHYMKNPLAFNNTKIKASQPKNMFKFIDEHFSTMAFCPRWLEEGGLTNVDKSLKYLFDAGVVEPYPPLADVEGSFTSQFEHTFILRPTCKEIFSVGDDY